MKTIKKQISVLLAVMMILCSITAVSFSVSAAETTGGKITVKSNLCSSTSYDYTANDKQIEVKYFLQSDNMILNMQGGIYYDSSVLKLSSTNTAQKSVPGFTSGNYFVNFNLTNKALFNATSLNLFDFTSKGVFFTAVFDIVGSGNTEINLDMDVITATTAKSYDELNDASDVDLVYYGDIASDKFAFSCEGKLISDSTAATVYFAAPRVAPGRTVWSDVDIYYNDTTSVIKSNRIHMKDTGLVIDNPAGSTLKTTRRGNWHVFSADLTADQVNAIDSAKYSGFVYAGNYNLKTSAKFDIKMGGSIADFDGQVFLINAAVTNSEVDSYTGAWSTEKPFKPEYKATTLKFACPTQNWSGGVYFYYGASSVITTVTKLEMTPSGKTLSVPDSLVSSLTKYVGGDWEVYTLDLTAEQVEIIDNSSVSGFCSGSSIYVKTSSARNVFRDYNSVSDLANYAFVATGCVKADQERASLTGKWRWCTI